jgi:hypothetical protein
MSLQPKPNMQTVLTVFCQISQRIADCILDAYHPYMAEQTENEITHPQTLNSAKTESS